MSDGTKKNALEAFDVPEYKVLGNGLVEEYVTRGTTLVERFYTIRLAPGAPTRVATFDWPGSHRPVKATSNSPYLTANLGVFVLFGWYRPTKKEFDALGTFARAHVLKGGLLLAKLEDAIGRNVYGLVAQKEWPEFCHQIYGINPVSPETVAAVCSANAALAAKRGEVASDATDPHSPDLGGEGGGA